MVKYIQDRITIIRISSDNNTNPHLFHPQISLSLIHILFHQTNKRFFEDLKKYPHVFNMVKKNRDKDSESTIAFFKSGVEQGLFRDDVNFAIVNLLVREQFDLLRCV